jgi:hypothetical protein
VVSSKVSQVQRAEDDSMIRRYNDGLVSNDEFKAYLTNILARTTITPQERVEVVDRIRDLGVKVEAEKLEAVYRGTRSGTQERITAATNLANYYNARAASLIPGSVAHSNAVQAAGNWENTALTEQDRVERSSRTLTRAQSLAQISGQYDTSDPEGLRQQAKLYMDLRDQAFADGDDAEAFRFESMANNAVARAGTLETQMTAKEKATQRTSRLNELRGLQNLYHDGTISIQDLQTRLNTLNTAAVESEDVTLQNSINSFVDTVNRDIERGITRGEFGGLPTLSRNRKGAGSNFPDWDDFDDKYTAVIQDAKQKLRSGQMDPKTYTIEVTRQAMNRRSELERRIALMDSLPEDTKVMLNGVKKAVGQLKQLYDEEIYGDPVKGNPPPSASLAEPLDVIEKKNPALATAILEEPYMKVSLERAKELFEKIPADFVFVQKGSDPENITLQKQPIDLQLDENGNSPNYLADERGVWHQIIKRTMTFNSAEEMNQFLTSHPGLVPTSTGQAQGRWVIDTGQGFDYVDVPDESGNPMRYVANPQTGVFEPQGEYWQGKPWTVENLLRQAQQLGVIGPRSILTRGGLEAVRSKVAAAKLPSETPEFTTLEPGAEQFVEIGKPPVGPQIAQPSAKIVPTPVAPVTPAGTGQISGLPQVVKAIQQFLPKNIPETIKSVAQAAAPSLQTAGQAAQIAAKAIAPSFQPIQQGIRLGQTVLPAAQKFVTETIPKAAGNVGQFLQQKVLQPVVSTAKKVLGWFGIGR